MARGAPWKGVSVGVFRCFSIGISPLLAISPSPQISSRRPNPDDLVDGALGFDEFVEHALLFHQFGMGSDFGYFAFVENHQP